MRAQIAAHGPACRLAVVGCVVLAISLGGGGVESPPCRAAEAARWPYERSAGIFSLHADFDLDRAGGGPLVTGLATLADQLHAALGIEIRAEPVHLILFARQTEYQAYLAQHFPNVPDRRALFIKRRGPGMVFAFWSAQLGVDLRHESTHALLNASLPYVPLWLDEGLAEYFEPAAGERTAGHSHQRSVRFRALLGQVPSIERLEAIDDLSGMGTAEYREAWSIVHFLLHESDQSRAVLVGFLRDLQAHSPPGRFSRRLQAELPEWQSRYLQHFRGW